MIGLFEGHKIMSRSTIREPIGYPELARLAGSATRVFKSIAERWRLSERESLAVLGLMDWNEELDRGAVERTSHLLAIFKAINTLLPVRERADGWIRAANKAATFGGRAPIDLMTTANVEDLKSVRQYLESQVEAPYL